MRLREICGGAPTEPHRNARAPGYAGAQPLGKEGKMSRPSGGATQSDGRAGTTREGEPGPVEVSRPPRTLPDVLTTGHWGL